jgi:predicted TIM-barrel fold metal-dependent hydrolase
VPDVAGVKGIPIVDTMIGFAAAADADRELPQVKASHRGRAHTADYMFTDVPNAEPPDAVDATLAEMDRHGVAVGLVSTSRPEAIEAVRRHPERFVLETHVGRLGEPLDIVGEVRRIRAEHEAHGTRAVSFFPVGPLPPIPVDAAAWYPIYATCVELGLPVFVNAGVPGPRVPMAAQHVERFDRVCYDFPELTLVMRHGAEPFVDLAVKLLLKWPGLHYSTSAFAPRHYPAAILDFLNTRGRDKVLYGGYFPMALTLERITRELAELPLRDDAWEPFLAGNARRILGMSGA